MFWPFHSSLGLHPSILSDVRVGSQERDPAASLPGRLVGHSRISPSPAGTSSAPLSFLSGLGVVVN